MTPPDALNILGAPPDALNILGVVYVLFCVYLQSPVKPLFTLLSESDVPCDRSVIVPCNEKCPNRHYSENRTSVKVSTQDYTVISVTLQEERSDIPVKAALK
ncbi:hypothetical protein E5288_WYG006740 [Bos mutus]|uniref:Uncharacterized protein n=1 Tax=Bos mutus TaxID=72004 RepID=A0A6B0RMD5_9CETA|nr:hypothetical protein [Bos mutus]